MLQPPVFNCRINIKLRSRVKSKEGDEMKFVPKFNKKKNGDKSNAAKQANRDVPGE